MDSEAQAVTPKIRVPFPLLPSAPRGQRARRAEVGARCFYANESTSAGAARVSAAGMYVGLARDKENEKSRGKVKGAADVSQYGRNKASNYPTSDSVAIP